MSFSNKCESDELVNVMNGMNNETLFSFVIMHKNNYYC